MQSAQLQSALAQVVGAAHATPPTPAQLQDWTGSVRGTAAVAVAPASTAEVAGVLALANAHHIPVTIQGGNTGMSGGSVPLADGKEGQGGGILLTLRRLRHIRHLCAAEQVLTAEAGCTLAEVQAAAAEVDLFFPLSLGSQGSCQIGGNLSTNAGGLNVLRYGSVRNWCLGVEAVLADGSVYHGLSALHKDNSGYNLRDLLIGAEGTLGIITAATLKLIPPPPVVLTAWAAPPSPRAALELLSALQRASGGALTAFEMLPAQALHHLRRACPQMPLPFAEIPPWSVLLEAAGEGVSADALCAALAQAQAEGTVAEVVVATSETQRADFWRVREEMPLHLAKIGKWARTDVSLPRTAVAAFMEEVQARLDALGAGTALVGYGHLGDGNLHLNFRPQNSDPQDAPELAAQISEAIYECVAAHNGSFSAEHGIGQLKVNLMQKYKDPTALKMMHQIKQALDPNGILNPGKVLAAGG